MTPQDRYRIQSRISAALSNLGVVKAYWLPEPGRVLCRSVCVTRRFRVPEGAILVGTYSQPFNSAAFLDDLEEALRRRELGRIS